MWMVQTTNRKKLRYFKINMKKKLALLGAIEGTRTGRLEKDYLLLVECWRRFAGKYKDIDIILLQPTDNDISPEVQHRLDELDVNYTKIYSDYNQSFRDFNYTNKPIACEWFYDYMSSQYDYTIWLDGDVLVVSEPTIIFPDDDEVVYIYNNERIAVKNGNPVYVEKNAPSYVDDQISYDDMMKRVGFQNQNYQPTNSWYILAKSQNAFWKDWNILTNKFVTKINRDENEKKQYRFAETNINFENRVEELTMEIVLRQSNQKKIDPVNVVTYNTPDAEVVYNEDFNSQANIIHYDDIDYIKLDCLKQYINQCSQPVKTFIKQQIVKIYGLECYQRIFSC